MGKRWIWIVVALLVLGAGGWLFVKGRTPASSASAVDPALSTAEVVRAPFESTISATGSVRSERSQRLSFGTSGTVTEILVRELDTVTAGQVLARLDDQDVRLNLADAEAALEIAQAQLVKAQAEKSDSELAIIEASLASAQAAVDMARAGVDAARANQQRVLAGPSADEVRIAERRVDDAKNALWGAQAQRDAVCGQVGVMASQADCDAANSRVKSGEIAVEIATLELQRMQAGVSAADAAAAKAQVDQALAQLASANAQLQRTQAEAEQARQGASEADLSVVQAQVEQAQVRVDAARARLADVELRAPADGIVADISLLVGDMVAAGNPVVTLIDSHAYHLLLSIDETDIGQVTPGQEATVTLDAYPSQPVLGTVSSIGAVGNNVQGITMFDVRVNIDATDLALRPFMTAAVDIVVNRQEDAVLVPNRALQRDANGRFVQRIEGDQAVRVPVTLGASNAEYTIVTEGLQPGDKLLLPRPGMSIGVPFGM
ncbi:MAG: efflux RND transporter periplasmic adaptor subunit [Anaerolineae bacterium]|nr:efflux RND transporter periplasmic adaptor subunit [Chloroflexota bacterium]